MLKVKIFTFSLRSSVWNNNIIKRQNKTMPYTYKFALKGTPDDKGMQLTAKQRKRLFCSTNFNNLNVQHTKNNV